MWCSALPVLPGRRLRVPPGGIKPGRKRIGRNTNLRSWVLTDPPGAKRHTHPTHPHSARQDGRYPNASPTRVSC